MWDFISYKVYGSERYTNELFNANPQLQNVFIFSANQTVYIPEINTAVEEQLPPWLREPVNNLAIQANDFIDLVTSSVDYSNVISYRFVDKFNRIVTKSSLLEG